MNHSHRFHKTSHKRLSTENSHARHLPQQFLCSSIVAGLFLVFVLAFSGLGQTFDPQSRGSQQQQSTPTPTPPVTDKAKEFMRRVREQQEKQLNEHGPQPST